MEPPTASWRAKLLDALRTLNLFDSESSDTNIIQRERWSTRVYLVLLCLFMLSLTIYSAQLSRTILVKRSQPTEGQFVQLFACYPNTLTCPCSRVAIQYREIVRSQVTFHEVCQSHFISQENIDASYGANVSFLSPVDIRTTLSAFWQVVRSFCTLSKNTWNDVQIDFDGTLLLSPVAQPLSLVRSESSIISAVLPLDGAKRSPAQSPRYSGNHPSQWVRVRLINQLSLLPRYSMGR